MNKLPFQKHPFHGPQLLICKEKHGNRFFYIPTEAHLHAIALKIVRQRFDEGWYGTNKEEFETNEDLDALKAQVNAISNPDLRRGATAELKRKQERVAHSKESLEQYLTAKEALDKNYGELAWELLSSRAEYEYEYVTLADLDPVPDLLPRPENPEHGRTWVDAEGNRWVYDKKTFQSWIPRKYNWVYYDVLAHRGDALERAEMAEVRAYERS